VCALGKLLSFLCSTCAEFVACALLPKEEESMLSVWKGVAKVQLIFMS